jgi:hypothetical protein
VDDNKQIVGMLSLGDICRVSRRRAAKVVTAVSAHHR